MSVAGARRVLFPFHGKTLGGSHVSSLSLIRQLHQTEFEPVVTVHEPGLLTTLLDQEGIAWLQPGDVTPVGHGSIIRQLRQAFAAATPLANFLQQHAIDLVHTNDDVMHLTWMAATRKHRCRHLWHLRTAGMSRRRAIYAGLFGADFCTISAYCLQSYSASVRKRCPIIPNPIAVSQTPDKKMSNRQWLIETLNLPAEAPIVGWVGNLTEQKRPLQVLQIARAMASKRPMSFILVGERRQPQADQVDAYIREHRLESIVHQVGVQIPADRWISGFDVLLATAQREGLGRSILEAMAMATPVVASADGGHQQIIDHGRTGLLAPLQDTDAYVSALLSLIDDPQTAQELTDHALREVQEHYAVRDHTAAVCNVYKSILRN